MTINNQLTTLVNDFIMQFGVGHITSTKEICMLLADRYGTTAGSVIPSDFCYNRVNKGIQLNKPTLFEYLGNGDYRCLGENYPFNGAIFHKPKDMPEKIIGNCINGVRIINPSNDIGSNNLNIDMNLNQKTTISTSFSSNRAQRLADVLCEMFDLRNAILSEEYSYSSLPLCVIDAIYSINSLYTSTRNTVIRYCNKYGLERLRQTANEFPPANCQHSVSELIENINKIGIETFSSSILKNRQRTSTRNGILKAEAVYLWASILQKHGIQYFQDLQEKGLTPQAELELLNTPGQRSGISLQYFYMLSGNDTYCKPDRHVLCFLSEILNQKVSKDEAQQIFNDAVALLKNSYPNINVRLLDYTIWNYMSSKKS